MKRLLSLLALCSAFLATSAIAAADKPAAPVAPAQPAPDLSGTWAVTVQTDGGGGSPVFTFKQDGEKITGTYKGAFGEAPVTGTLKGAALKFSFKISGQGQEMTVDYDGTVDGDTFKGKVRFGDLGEGTFTGKKQSK